MNEQEKQIAKRIIDYINWNFSEIRNDWSDPRWNCREGWEAVSRLRGVLGLPESHPYRHGADMPLDKWMEEREEILEER